MRWVRAFVIVLGLEVAVACGRTLASSGGDPDGGPPPDAAAPTTSADAADDPTIACDGGLCDCNGDPADGLETDITSAPSDCGRCGRRCPNGDCKAGACEMIPLFASPRGHDLLATESKLFATFDGADPDAGAGTVRMLHLSGGAPTGDARNFRASQFEPRAPAAIGDALYWVARGSGDLWRGPLDCDAGCGTRIAQATSDGIGSPWLATAVTGREDELFWVNYVPSRPDALDGLSRIYRLERAGGDPSDAGSWRSTQVGVGTAGHVVDITTGAPGRLVYVREPRDGGVPRALCGTDERCDAGVSCHRVMVQLADKDTEIRLHGVGSSVWLTRPSAGEIARWDDADERLTVVVSGEAGVVRNPVVDGDDLFWVTGPSEGVTGSRVRHTSIACGTPCAETVAFLQGGAAPAALAVTSSAFFLMAGASEQSTVFFTPR